MWTHNNIVRKQALFSWKRKHTLALPHRSESKKKEKKRNESRKGESNKVKQRQCTNSKYYENKWKANSFWCFPISWTILHHETRALNKRHVSFMLPLLHWSVCFSRVFPWQFSAFRIKFAWWEKSSDIRFFLLSLLLLLFDGKCHTTATHNRCATHIMWFSFCQRCASIYSFMGFRSELTLLWTKWWKSKWETVSKLLFFLPIARSISIHFDSAVGAADDVWFVWSSS